MPFHQGTCLQLLVLKSLWTHLGISKKMIFVFLFILSLRGDVQLVVMHSFFNCQYVTPPPSKKTQKIWWTQVLNTISFFICTWKLMKMSECRWEKWRMITWGCVMKVGKGRKGRGVRGGVGVKLKSLYLCRHTSCQRSCDQRLWVGVLGVAIGDVPHEVVALFGLKKIGMNHFYKRL